MKTKIVIMFLLIISVLAGCSSESGSGSKAPISQTRPDIMGTVITISIYQEAEPEVFEEVFNDLSDIADRMTIQGENQHKSELAELSELSGKEAVKVSADTFLAIEKALKMSEDSNGAFNLAVGPLVKLWDINTEAAAIPDEEQINTTLKKVNYMDVVLDADEKSVYLEHEGMMIDLGGVAKGYGGDVAADILRKNGIKSAICDLGGNIVTVGSRPDGLNWRVGVRNPVIGENGYLGIINVSDKVVVTSGGYERYFEQDGIIYHHILDTKTGFPSDSGLLSVTIISESSITADLLSTAAFVLGLEEGMPLVEKYSAEAIFVTNDKKVYVTDGLSDSFSLTDPGFVLTED